MRGRPLALSALLPLYLAGAARTPMQAFLADARARLLAGPPAAGAAARRPALRPTLVLGNMAGDLDTMVSSVVTAYTRHLASLEPARTEPTVHSPLVVPLMPFARREFRLRQDAVALFGHCGFTFDAEGAPPELLFADELTDAAIAAWHAAALLAAAAPGGPSAEPGTPLAEPFQLILTDHNRLDAATGARLRTATVVAILDHHSDEGRHAELSGTERLIDVSAGSACSLVFERLDFPALLAAAAAAGGAGGGGALGAEGPPPLLRQVRAPPMRPQILWPAEARGMQRTLLLV